jgi:hypothetical protein
VSVSAKSSEEWLRRPREFRNGHSEIVSAAHRRLPIDGLSRGSICANDRGMAGEKRYFTVAEANALLPALEARFGMVMQLRAQLRNAYAALEHAGEPPTPESLLKRDGPDELRKLRGRFRALLEALTEELAAVEELGVAVKDLDIGLCDFLGERDGRDVWLCWQYGEKQVAFWHELDAGFAGRRPLHDPAAPDRLLH